MGKVQVIKAEQYNKVNNIPEKHTKNVAAYCRVSTSSEEQLNSYQAQVSYYGSIINENPKWELVDIYADEGISGTDSKKRLEFNRMISDAKKGKIDLILTKSISRFARNVVDTLRYTRTLKELGIAVEFEKERINTLEASGELMMTIFSSLAQEESRSISENSRWGIVRGFQEGKVFCNTLRFLGYDKNENGELVINEEEAKIVRRIYKEYLEGKSYNKIAKGLMKDGISTVTGNKKWWDSTVTLILTNEKYCGDLLQQKTITIDFLSHKRIKNKGNADQYLLRDNHEAIIPREIWEEVQKEKERRALLKNNIKDDRGKYSSLYPFSGKVVCGDCGETFKRRTWNSNNPSKKIVWQCKTYIKDGKDVCDMKAVDDKVLKDSFVEMFNELKIDKERFFKTLTENIEKVIENCGHYKEIEKLDKSIAKKKDEIKHLVKLQTTGKLDGEIYNEEYQRIAEELNKLRDEKSEFEQDEDRKEELKRRVTEIIDVIKGREGLLEEFDMDIFNALVEKIEVLSPTHFVFVLQSGLVIKKNFNN